LAFKLLILIATTSLFSSASEQRLKLLRDMEGKGLLREANCREVANSVLKRFGLPALGANAQVKGQRKAVDRGGATQNPPIFRDGIQMAGSNDVVNLQTALQGNLWLLTIDRAIAVKDDVLSVSSIYSFDSAGPRKNYACELQKISFKVSSQKARFAPMGDFNGDKCADFVMTHGKAPIKDASAMKDAVMVEDCRRGLSYFADVKKKLTGIRKGHK